MKTSDFEYELPSELIAQEPAPVRDQCRLLVMDRKTGALTDRIFSDLVDYVRPGDLFVANETRVIPARLLGTKRGSGGACEVLLLREVRGTTDAERSKSDTPGNTKSAHSNQQATWEALVRPGKRLKPGNNAIIDFHDHTGNVALSAEVTGWATDSTRGARRVCLSTPLPTLSDALACVGHTPLPPYIKNYTGDEELYQTVYAKRETSAAAPTAGLHFTPELIARLQTAGARWETVELDVGIDTFRIVDEDDPADHRMHTEFYSVPEQTARAINETKANGGRIIAVGTTSVRSLESAWDAHNARMEPCEHAATSLYLLPGSKFHVVDGLITNFHVPRSTLLMLVSAFSSREHVMAAYQHAIDARYRFFSFGDAMFIA